MDELGIQHDLCAEANSLGAYAFKSNCRFLVGIPDLSIQWPGLPHIWLEIKYARGIRRDGFAKLQLTSRQRGFIIRTQAAGGLSGWLLVARVGTRGDYLLSCGTDPSVTSVNMLGDDVMKRERGGTWPIEEAVRRLAGGIDDATSV